MLLTYFLLVAFFSLAELNDIKYSAYRTAMKLRCIQRASSRKFQLLRQFNVFYYISQLVRAL